MMPITRLSLTMATILLSGLPMAYAAGNSEFGQPFSNTVPVALQDPADPAIATAQDGILAEDLNEIAPAAGIAGSVDGMTPATDNIVGQDTGAPVSHTDVDRSGSDQSQHNSIGE